MGAVSTMLVDILVIASRDIRLLPIRPDAEVSIAVPWVRQTAQIPFLQSSKKRFHHLFVSDVNECTEVPGYCQNGICTNTIGSSRCRCRMGYRMNQSGDACIGNTTLKLCVTQGTCIATENPNLR